MHRCLLAFRNLARPLLAVVFVIGAYGQQGWALPASKIPAPRTTHEMQPVANFWELAENPTGFVGRGLVRFRPGLVVSDSVFERGVTDGPGYRVTARILAVIDAAELNTRGRLGLVLVALAADASLPGEDLLGKSVEVEGVVEQVPAGKASDDNLLHVYLADTARSLGIVGEGRQALLAGTALPYIRAIRVMIAAD